MKPLLLLLSICLLTTSLFAQEGKLDIEKLLRDSNSLHRNYSLFENRLQQPFTQKFFAPTDNSSAFKAPGIYRLPQDGMPCLVPDTKMIAAIPNAFSGSRFAQRFLGGRIPNPALPPAQAIPFNYKPHTK